LAQGANFIDTIILMVVYRIVSHGKICFDFNLFPESLCFGYDFAHQAPMAICLFDY
jgi:hypothetical protein